MKNIAAALVKARGEFGPALKNAVNPHLKNRYANLEACLDAVTEPLIRNDIYMYQETSEDPAGVTVETVFLHASGESVRCGKLHVPAVKSDPQGYGSALTYARRYSLVTACGLAQEDDDGGKAARATPKQTQEPTMTTEQVGKIVELMDTRETDDESRQKVSKWLKSPRSVSDGEKLIAKLQAMPERNIS